MGAWCFSFPKCKSCHYSTRFSPTSLQQKTVTKNYFFKSLIFQVWPNTIDKGAESEPLKLKYNIFLPFKKMCSLPQKFPYDVSTDFWCTNKTFLSPQLCTKGSLLWPQSRNAWENPLICNISLSSKSHFCSSTHFKVAKLHFLMLTAVLFIMIQSTRTALIYRQF